MHQPELFNELPSHPRPKKRARFTRATPAPAKPGYTLEHYSAPTAKERKDPTLRKLNAACRRFGVLGTEWDASTRICRVLSGPTSWD